MSLPVVVIGVSHKTAPVDVRERFAAGSEVLPELLARLTSRAELDEVMFLSTCNRVEVIALPKREHGPMDASRAVRDALREHIGASFERADYDGPLMRRLVELLAKNRVVTNMTFFVNHLVYNIDDPHRAIPDMEMYRRYSYPGTLETAIEQLKASNAGWTPDDYQRARAVMPKVLKLGALLHQAGVPMMIGTDGTGGGPYYATELALHQQAGIPVWAILRMATSGATELLGIGNRTGRIEPGLEADVVFLTADPVVDIANASKVHGVLDNGRLHLFTDLTGDLK
jgi:hypothetical protein